MKNCKRRLSGNPRVPFSSRQLRALEETYNENRYLSVPQVEELATSLELPHHRIKIWFQNRRAREKRSLEKSPMSGKNVLLPQQKQQGGCKYDTPCFVPFSSKTSFVLNHYSLANLNPPFSAPDRCIYRGVIRCGRASFQPWIKLWFSSRKTRRQFVWLNSPVINVYLFLAILLSYLS